MGGEDILGGIIGLGSIPIAGNGGNQFDILGSFKHCGSTCSASLGLACTGKTLQNGNFAALRQTGDHIIGNDLTLIAELNGNLAIQVTAGLCKSSGIHARTQIDDFNTLLIALYNAGDQIGAINGRNNDNIIIHIGHGHQNIQLTLSITLGGAGLNIDLNAKLLSSGFVANLHIGPELIGEGDDDSTNLLAIGGRGLT